MHLQVVEEIIFSKAQGLPLISFCYCWGEEYPLKLDSFLLSKTMGLENMMYDVDSV